MHRRARLVAILGVAAVLGIACGSGDGANGNGGGGPGTGGNGDLDGAFVTTNSGDGGNNSNNNANCIAPVDMFIMFDRSGSMNEPQADDQGDCNIGQNVDSKWCKSINALSGYFKSQGANGQAAALQFFPLSNHSDNLCRTGTGYDVAALPPTGYAQLPTPLFDNALNNQTPGGINGSAGTPTEAAIRGLTKFTAANRRGGRVTIGILITDGDPNGCNERLSALSDLLAAHNKATQIRTYVIGMKGATFDNLEKIAAGGAAPPHADAVAGITDACGNGGGPCRHWNVGDGDPKVFSAALAAIQESADGCKDGGGFVNPK